MKYAKKYWYERDGVMIECGRVVMREVDEGGKQIDL